MRRHLALLAILLLVPGLAGASAVFSVDGPQEETIRPPPGEPVPLDYTLRNRQENPVDWFTDVDPPGGWTATVAPPNGTVPPGGSQRILVTLEPGDAAAGGPASTTFTAFERNATAYQQVTRTVDLDPRSPPEVLGAVPNPLPAPLDGAGGAALLNLLAWAGLVVGAFVAAGPLLRRIGGTQRTGEKLQALVRVPLAVLLALWGIHASLRILSPTRPVVLTATVLETARLVAGVWLGFRVFRGMIIYYRQRVAPKTDYELDAMFIPLLEKLGAAFFVAAGFLLLLSDLGVDVGVLLAAGGFASVIIGFAAQNTLSNFFSGVNILLDRPFREGDDIQLESGEVVRVEKIGLRTTQLYHYLQHEIIIVPNNDLATKRVANLIYPDQRYRWSIDVSVAYGTDTSLVEDLLYRAADEHPDVVGDPPEFEPVVLFMGFGDNGLEHTVRFFIDDVRERWRVAAEIRGRIDDLFDEHDVTVPFPQRTHWFKSTLHHKEGELPPPPDPGDAAREGPDGGGPRGEGEGPGGPTGGA